MRNPPITPADVDSMLYDLDRVDFDSLTSVERTHLRAALLEKQGGICLICRQGGVVTRIFALDHDHATGRIRGVLCRQCNFGLAEWWTPDLLRAAADYLEAGQP